MNHTATWRIIYSIAVAASFLRFYTAKTLNVILLCDFDATQHAHLRHMLTQIPRPDLKRSQGRQLEATPNGDASNSQTLVVMP